MSVCLNTWDFVCCLLGEGVCTYMHMYILANKCISVQTSDVKQE